MSFGSFFSSFVFLSGRVFEFTFAKSIFPTILTALASALTSGTITGSVIGATTTAGLGAFGALDVTFLIKISNLNNIDSILEKQRYPLF